MKNPMITLTVLLSASAAACVDGELPEVGEETIRLTVDEVFAGADSDGDGMPDLIDNCPDVANPTTFDADGDGIGNACDADYDNDGFVAGTDFGIFLQAFNSTLGDPNFNAVADHIPDENNTITTLDYLVLLNHFNSAVPETNFVNIEDVQDGDTHMMVITQRIDGALRYGTLLRPISNVVRYPNGRLESFIFGRSRLTMNDDGTWTAQGSFPSYDTGLIDPTFFAGNTLEFLSSFGGSNSIHTAMHILAVEVEF